MNRDITIHGARWGRALLIAAAACGQIAFLIVHEQLGVFRTGGASSRGWLLAFLAIVIPFAATRFARYLHEDRGVSQRKARRVYAVEWLPLLFARTDTPTLFLITSLVILTGHALARPRQDSVSVWALAGGLTLTLVGAATVPSAHWLWLLPLSLVTCGSSLVLLHVNRGLAFRDSLKRWSFMSTGAAPSKLPRPAQLALYGLPFALLTLLCIPIVSYGILSIPTPFDRSLRAPNWRAANSEPRRRDSEVDVATRVAFEGVFPSDLSYGRGVARLEHETVMFVRPPEGLGEKEFRRRAPYYLRGLVQDHFTESGVTFGGGTDLRELERSREEWLTLRENTEEAVIELELHQQPLLTRQGDWNILFSPQPIVAVRAKHVKFDLDGVLVSLDDDSQWKRYGVRAGIDDARLWNLSGLDAFHLSDRFTQLPPSSPELTQLKVEAQRITAEATNDSERVAAIVEHFKERFIYALDAKDTPGLGGVLEFLANRRGHCTDFASASALMLRTLGIPTRVATGFLADEWSEEAGGFEVTTRDGHAWLEVYFEYVGWMRYEPTPTARRLRALQAAAREGETGLGSWVSDLGSDFSYWASSGMDESDLRLWFQTLGSGPRAFVASVGRQPLLFGGIAVAILAAWFGLTKAATRRAKVRAGGTRNSAAHEEDGYLRILRALEKRGHTKPSAQTPREFAQRIASQHEPWASIIPVTELLYRARFGGEELSTNEQASFEELARTIRA